MYYTLYVLGVVHFFAEWQNSLEELILENGKVGKRIFAKAELHATSLLPIGELITQDVTFGEDLSRLRTGNAPQVMAALRNPAITLIHRSGSFQIAQTRRHFSSQPQEALAFLLPRRKVA